MSGLELPWFSSGRWWTVGQFSWILIIENWELWSTPSHPPALSICASCVARADAASDEANTFRDDGGFQLPDQATVSPGCVFQPDFACSNCIYHLVDQCGWGKVFQIVSSRFLSESLLNHWPKRGITGFCNSCALFLNSFWKGCQASEFIDLKVFDSENQMNGLSWQWVLSALLFISASDYALLWVDWCLVYQLVFCWIRFRLDGNRYISWPRDWSF